MLLLFPNTITRIVPSSLPTAKHLGNITLHFITVTLASVALSPSAYPRKRKLSSTSKNMSALVFVVSVVLARNPRSTRFFAFSSSFVSFLFDVTLKSFIFFTLSLTFTNDLLETSCNKCPALNVVSFAFFANFSAFSLEKRFFIRRFIVVPVVVVVVEIVVVEIVVLVLSSFEGESFTITVPFNASVSSSSSSSSISFSSTLLPIVVSTTTFFTSRFFAAATPPFFTKASSFTSSSFPPRRAPSSFIATAFRKQQQGTHGRQTLLKTLLLLKLFVTLSRFFSMQKKKACVNM